MSNSNSTEVDRVRTIYSRRPSRADYFGVEAPFHMERIYQRRIELARRLYAAGLRIDQRTRILDLGCGTGDGLGTALDWGVEPARVAGIDILFESVTQASARYPSTGTLVASATNIPFLDCSFDVVTANTVFSSILDSSIREAIAAETVRVLDDNGAIAIYDLRTPNPSNPDLIHISHSELRRLYPGCLVSSRPISLNPAIARRLPLRDAKPIGHMLLSRVRPLRSHRLTIVRKQE